MLRPLLLVLLAPLVRTAIVDPPTLADRLDQLYEKIEKFTPTAPPHAGTPEKLVKLFKKLERFAAPPTTERPIEKLYEKLDRLNSLTPDKFFSDDDEDLVDAMQEWGMSEEQIDAVVKGMQRKSEGEEYDWNDEDLQDLDDYAQDGIEDMDPEEGEDPQNDSIGPSMKMAPMDLNREPGRSVDAALDPIAATEERPRLLDDSGLSKSERAELRNKAKAHFTAVLKNSKCLTPQPRWLSVQQLAPSADTHYFPPCVQLHRCAPDSGCCRDADVCAPIDGHYVTLPFLLDKVGRERGSPTLPARMQFFNHTRCECVPRGIPRVRPPRRDTTVTTVTAATRVTPVTPVARVTPTQRPAQRATVRGSAGNARLSDVPTQGPKPENETTAPLRRCTCPTLFLARMSEAGCACVCDWPDPARSRDCLTLARGREHFGLRDRVCIADGGCSPPSCSFGTYEKNLGKCPLRRAQSSGSDAIFEHPGDGFRSVTNLKLDP